MEVLVSKKKKSKMCEPTSLAEISSDSKMSYGNHGKIPRALHHSQGHDNLPEASKQNQVGTVMLFGVPIVSLVMDGKERLCLAQISSTLLKEFSYNEIHNRRVALGITCIQCTPVQLEILRRAGAMPVTSRRCGMITRREAERLCQSFLGDHAPPQLPENFAFEVYHECAWGCRGAFVPSRYNSSRAKCIRCTFCQLFFSPNKFIFHSHRLPDSRYVQPDAANFNSWRRHLKLCGDPPEDVEPQSSATGSSAMMTAQIVHAWEDVKAMFNGGTRKRLLAAHSIPSPTSHKRPGRSSPHGCGTPNGNTGGSSSNMQNSSSHPHGLSSEKFPSPSAMLTPISAASSSSSSSSPPGNNTFPYPSTTSASALPRSSSNGASQFIPPHHLHGFHHLPTDPQILPTPSNTVLNSPSCLPGSPPRLDAIWNPGLSAAAAAAAVAASRSSASLPHLSFHPLSMPWFRRPLPFPFSHPFGPKLFENQVGQGNLTGGSDAARSLALSQHLPASAFKPVPGSRSAEQLFSWLNNNNNTIVHTPGMYPSPEDLSLASSADFQALVESKAGMKLGLHHAFPTSSAENSMTDSSKENVHSSRDESHPVKRSRKPKTQRPDSEDEETVDIETTPDAEAAFNIDPMAHWFASSARGVKRSADEGNSVKQEADKYESPVGKKKMWDCDRRTIKVRSTKGESCLKNCHGDSRSCSPPMDANDSDSPPSTPEILSLTD